MATSISQRLSRGDGFPAVDDATARILDAALTLIEVQGVQRTTMDDLASAAGVGRATIYRRFGTKDQVIVELFVRELARVLKEVDASISSAWAVEDRLVEGFAVAMQLVLRHPLTRLMALEPNLSLPHVTYGAGPALEIARRFLAEHLRSAQHRRETRDFDADIVAELIVRLCHSLLVSPSGWIDAQDPDRARAFARSYLVPLVAGSAPASNAKERK